EPMGYHPKTSNVFMAVMIGYLANLALPRLGEVSRCGILTRYEKIPFNKSF
ncbi:MAG TPA: TIGR00374 family protein, partial [Bacteroidales bacterium]|nr:TIGR00374 family protein [Bacteroidales bacterium]